MINLLKEQLSQEQKQQLVQQVFIPKKHYLNSLSGSEANTPENKQQYSDQRSPTKKSSTPTHNYKINIQSEESIDEVMSLNNHSQISEKSIEESGSQEEEPNNRLYRKGPAQDMTVSKHSQQMEETLFQKLMLKRDKLRSGNDYMDEAMMILIFKEKINRSSIDIQKLMRATAEMDFFSKLNEKKMNRDQQIHEKLCVAMDHEFYKKGKVVFYQNDHADRFYILLKGQVTILIQKTDEELKEEIQLAYYQWKLHPVNQSKAYVPYKQVNVIQKIFTILVFQRAVKRLMVVNKFFRYLWIVIQNSDSSFVASDISQDFQNSISNKHSKRKMEESEKNNEKFKIKDVKLDFNKIGQVNMINMFSSMQTKYTGSLLEQKKTKLEEEQKKKSTKWNLKGFKSMLAQQQIQKTRKSLGNLNSPLNKTENLKKSSLSPLKPPTTPKASEEIAKSPKKILKLNFLRKSVAVTKQEHEQNQGLLKPLIEKQQRDSLIRRQKNAKTQALLKLGTQYDNISSSILPSPTRKDDQFSSSSHKNSLLQSYSNQNSPTKIVSQEFHNKLKNIKDDQEIKYQDFQEFDMVNRVRMQNQMVIGELGILKVQKLQQKISKQIPTINFDELENAGHFFKGDVFKYHHIVTLSKGFVFGELGLINKKPRSATVICLQDTHFGVLTTKEYGQILLKLQKAKFMKKVRFIAESISKSFSLEKISKLAYSFKKVKYSHGERIYEEGDKGKQVFLVKKGTVELHKKVKTQNSNFIEVRVSQMGKGEFFGEEDIILERDRKYQCVAFNDCTIYVAQADQFLRVIKNLTEFQEELKQTIKLKEDQRNLTLQKSINLREESQNLKRMMKKMKNHKYSLSQTNIDFNSKNQILETQTSQDSAEKLMNQKRFFYDTLPLSKGFKIKLNKKEEYIQSLKLREYPHQEIKKQISQNPQKTIQNIKNQEQNKKKQFNSDQKNKNDNKKYFLSQQQINTDPLQIQSVNGQSNSKNNFSSAQFLQTNTTQQSPLKKPSFTTKSQFVNNQIAINNIEDKNQNQLGTIEGLKQSQLKSLPVSPQNRTIDQIISFQQFQQMLPNKNSDNKEQNQDLDQDTDNQKQDSEKLTPYRQYFKGTKASIISSRRGKDKQKLSYQGDDLILQKSQNSKFLKKSEISDNALDKKELVKNLQNDVKFQKHITIAELWNQTRDLCIGENQIFKKQEKIQRQKFQQDFERQTDENQKKKQKIDTFPQKLTTTTANSTQNINLENKQKNNKFNSYHLQVDKQNFEGAGYFGTIMKKLNSMEGTQEIYSSKTIYPEQPRQSYFNQSLQEDIQFKSSKELPISQNPNIYQQYQSQQQQLQQQSDEQSNKSLSICIHKSLSPRYNPNQNNIQQQAKEITSFNNNIQFQQTRNKKKSQTTINFINSNSLFNKNTKFDNTSQKILKNNNTMRSMSPTEHNYKFPNSFHFRLVLTDARSAGWGRGSIWSHLRLGPRGPDVISG